MRQQISQETLEMALVGLRVEREQIVARIAEVRATLGGDPITRLGPIVVGQQPRRRELSAAGRAAIIAGARRRWRQYRRDQRLAAAR